MRDWKTGVSTYKAVLYSNIYDDIDLKVYGVISCIEYDWIVKPGSTPNLISFKYTDIQNASIDQGGNLVIDTGYRKMVHKKPFTYQDIDNERLEVTVSYKNISNNVYGFTVGDYNSNYKLVIDPVGDK
jgi:hypothetical protein